MGLLRTLLTAPVSAPMSGALWATSKVAEAAEAYFYDPAHIRRQLDELERAVEAGEIDEATYDAAEEVLMARLHTARERLAT